MTMRRLFVILLGIPLLLGAAPSRQFTYVTGQIIEPEEVTANEDAIFEYLQSGVDTYKTGSVNAAAIGTGAVGASELANDAVGTANIIDGTIIAADLAADSVEASEIATGAVTTTEILDDTVASIDIADGTIVTGDIATDTIVAGNIAAGAVETSEILDGTIANVDISSSAAIRASKLADDEIDQEELAATITFGASDSLVASDGTLVNLSAANASSTTDGLLLPQNTDCSAGTAEGQTCWDTDDDVLYIGDGSAAVRSGGGWSLVETLTLTGQTTVTSAALPTDADIFKVIFDSGSWGTNGPHGIRFNGDSGANYEWVSIADATLAHTAGDGEIQLSPNEADFDGWFIFHRPAMQGGHIVQINFLENGDPGIAVAMRGIWRSAAAITTVSIVDGGGASNMSGTAAIWKQIK